MHGVADLDDTSKELLVVVFPRELLRTRGRYYRLALRAVSHSASGPKLVAELKHRGGRLYDFGPASTMESGA